jgi:uncharacterized protein YoxC
MTIKDYILHKTGGLCMVPTIDLAESGKYIIMVKKGEYKSNFNKAKGWYDFEMRKYFEEYGVQKPGWPPTSTYREGYRAVTSRSYLDEMCRDIHSKVASATARQQATQPNSGTTQAAPRNGNGRAGTSTAARQGNAWGITTPPPRAPPKTIVEDLEPEHTASPETRALVHQASASQLITPEHPQYQQMLDVVSVGLGVPEMRETINALQQRNEVLQQQVQELHDKTDNVVTSVESVQTAVTRIEQHQEEQTASWEEKMQQAVDAAVLRQQESMQQMFQQFMLTVRPSESHSKSEERTAPTSVMVGSEPEVSSLTMEAHSPGKRSQASAALPQVTTQKKTRPDPHPPSPAGTPCTDHVTAITGEETRGDAT